MTADDRDEQKERNETYNALYRLSLGLGSHGNGGLFDFISVTASVNGGMLLRHGGIIHTLKKRAEWCARENKSGKRANNAKI